MRFLHTLKNAASVALRQTRWGFFKERHWQLEPGTLVKCDEYLVKINDGPNYYMQFKDEFVNRIYHFQSEIHDPFIIDGGSNMGISILHFKKVHPEARILGFEPDPVIFDLLSDNLSRNAVAGVQLVNAGLAAQDGESLFTPDGKAGGRLCAAGPVTVRMERLSKHLARRVDFLKLNIEGGELDVLREAAEAGLLRNVRELVVEYHGWPQGRQDLGHILNLLDAQGYRFLVHDFDAETCFASKPPFRLEPDTTWFCLVYAKRSDLITGRN